MTPTPAFPAWLDCSSHRHQRCFAGPPSLAADAKMMKRASGCSTVAEAADRAGLTGAASTLNAIWSLRYQQGISSRDGGRSFGRPADLIKRYSLGSDADSENTNTAERAAAGALYDVVLRPALGLRRDQTEGAAAGGRSFGVQAIVKAGCFPLIVRHLSKLWRGQKNDQANHHRGAPDANSKRS